MKMKKFRFNYLCLALALVSSNAMADSASQESSSLSVIGSSNIIKGSVQMLTAGSQLTISSVEQSGNFVILMLKDSAKGADLMLKLSASSLGNASLAVGNTIEVVAGSTGRMLMVSGEVIALIPNELGKNLVKSNKLD
jgi:hypothetical protein